MPRYSVEVTYDMGMSMGEETHKFEEKDDDAAREYIKKYEGDSLGDIKKGVHFQAETLSRVLD
jgi:hypothetical protein